MRIFILFLMAFFACRCGTVVEDGYGPAGSPRADLSKNVKGVVASPRPFVREIRATGWFEEKWRVELKAGATGTVMRSFVDEGHEVRAGDTIIILGSGQFMASLRQARNRLKLAEIELNSVLLGFGGAEGDSASVPPHLWEIAKLQSGYSEALEIYQSSFSELSALAVLSPARGFVLNISVLEGSEVIKGESICELVSFEPGIIAFPVMPFDRHLIEPGQVVTIEEPGWQDTLHCTGSVSSRHPYINDAGLIVFHAVLEPSCKGFIAGMRVMVNVLHSFPDCLVVPREAMTIRTGRTVVYTIENNLAVWNEVQVIDGNRECFRIGGGIGFGDTVLIDPGYDIYHGMPLNVSVINSYP